MKTPTSHPGSIAAWLDRFAQEVPDDAVVESAKTLLAAAHAQAAFAAAEVETVATLQLLDDLDLDVQTRTAFVLHALMQFGIGIEKKTLAAFRPGVRDLLEGQQAAEKVGELYKAHGGGNAEASATCASSSSCSRARLRACARPRGYPQSSAANSRSSRSTCTRRSRTVSASGS